MGYDLHIHTQASDGIFTAKEIIDQAKAMGLAGIAITDHDTTAAIPSALAYGQEQNFLVIPGIEISCEEELSPGDIHEVHILGYFYDRQNPALQQKLQWLQAHRQERAQQILKKLEEFGMPLQQDFLEQFHASGSVGRAVIARKMVEAGYVDSINEAFQLWLMQGKPAYVPRAKILPQEAIQLLHQAGGLAIFAHPKLAQVDEKIPDYIKAGLDGFEIHHPKLTMEDCQHYQAIAQQAGLLTTGGSDCHNGNLGCCLCSAEEFQAILQRHQQK